ncbi:HAD family hydrolase [Limnoglobus roseus]|uniref:HAD family phosphatase n=1 Tax=Limnoglobus roseus TaxID=2598579 RepID=A0A5C1AF96_9BACT|nr:HAD family phosphatase [Limnoglobus roseus]QEL17235.1 HAD family phosphatase [Limnoglobus roseus]
MKTIFLDFGNVIGFFDHGRALKHFARYTDVPHTELETMLYGGTLGDDYDSGRITTHQYLEHVKKLANFRCTDEEFLTAYTDIFWPNPDVCELVPVLAKKYRLVLASNTNDAHYQQFTKMFAPVLSHLQHLVASHVVGARKPRPEFYQRAQEWAHAEPHECVFVDDLPKNIAAAVAHGWTGVLYQSGDRLADKLRAAGVPIE